MYILGISCYYHDSAAALIENGEVVAAAQEERFTRKKHDSGFPYHAVAFCLRRAGITGRDLDYVAFYEKPILKFERILLTCLCTFPRSWSVFRESMISWFNEKLWIKSQLLNELEIPSRKLLFVEHHLSHAASAFFCSPFQESAIITADGVGEWATTTVARGRSDWDGTGVNRIDLLSDLRFPHSLGLLYSTFTAYLGFRVNNGEYKVMGMAPYGRPRYLDKVHQLVELANDGSFRLNMQYFDFHRSTRRTFSSQLVRLFGPPRVPESEFYTSQTQPTGDTGVARENQRFADIACSIQQVTEEILLKMARFAYEQTRCERLCLAGGVALNSVANGRILRETPFKQVFIQPAAGDAGGALGAALYVYHKLLGKPRSFVMEHAYWGEDYSSACIREALDAAGWEYQEETNSDRLGDMIVDDLLTGRVIGLFQGRFEWGPRALGNRSILADPRRAEMKDIVNASIKFREPFRPFAPVVPENSARDFYDGLRDIDSCYPVRYMLAVYKTRNGQAERIPAVTHVGGTGRLQTIRREWNPLYYEVVRLFGEATGIPVLLNTSYNLRGEPIVARPFDALRTFGSSGIDSLYMGRFVVRKQGAKRPSTLRK